MAGINVVLVGRPNVGKSTLFNRLVGRRVALTHEQPGVTRDRKEAIVKWGELQFSLWDTAGLFDFETSKENQLLSQKMKEQTVLALKDADLILFVIDGREGIVPYDRDIARLVRLQNRPVAVVVNKSENSASDHVLSEGFSLGWKEVIAISAEHGLGISDLYDILRGYCPKEYLLSERKDIESERSPFKLAVMGRPNVGKSTLINSIIQENRLIAEDFSGVTRDSITIPWKYNGKEIDLIDTAGIRRKNQGQKALESLFVKDAEKTLRFCDGVLLLIDASIPMESQIERQDLILADQVLEEGRVLVMGLNKWDKVSNPDQYLNYIKEQLEFQLSQGKGVTCLPLSATKPYGLEKIFKTFSLLEEKWSKRFATAPLNQWIREAVSQHPPPAYRGISLKIKYVTQIKSKPPTFVLFVNRPGELPTSYIRYLANSLRATFRLEGIPLRFKIRSGHNPYV